MVVAVRTMVGYRMENWVCKSGRMGCEKQEVSPEAGVQTPQSAWWRLEAREPEGA